MQIQALIPPALAVLHNFIQQYNPEEIHMYDDDDDDDEINFLISPRPRSVRELRMDAVTSREMKWANDRQDKIAGEMWGQYQCYLEDHVTHNE